MLALVIALALDVKRWLEDDAHRMVRYSTVAYCIPCSNPGKWDCASAREPEVRDFVVVQSLFDQKTDTRGYAGFSVSRSEIVLAFRGTTSLENWIQDLKVQIAISRVPIAESVCPRDVVLCHPHTLL